MIFHLFSVSEASGQTTVNACAGGIYSVTDATVYGFPPGLSADLKGMVQFLQRLPLVNLLFLRRL